MEEEELGMASRDALEFLEALMSRVTLYTCIDRARQYEWNVEFTTAPMMHLQNFPVPNDVPQTIFHFFKRLQLLLPIVHGSGILSQGFVGTVERASNRNDNLRCRRSRSRSFALDGIPNLKAVVMSRYSAFFDKNGLTSPALTSICG